MSHLERKMSILSAAATIYCKILHDEPIAVDTHGRELNKYDIAVRDAIRLESLIEEELREHSRHER